MHPTSGPATFEARRGIRLRGRYIWPQALVAVLSSGMEGVTGDYERSDGCSPRSDRARPLARSNTFARRGECGSWCSRLTLVQIRMSSNKGDEVVPGVVMPRPVHGCGKRVRFGALQCGGRHIEARSNCAIACPQ